MGSPPAIIHVAVADMDATYGAYVAAVGAIFAIPGTPGPPGGWDSEFFACSLRSPSGRPEILDLSSKTLDFSILHKSENRKIGIF